MIPYLSRLSLSRWFSELRGSGTVRRPVARRVRLAVEVLEGRVMPSLVTVTSASDDPSDTGSLRYALNNATPGETFDFAPNVRTIDLSNTLTIGVSLSIINDQGVGPVTIDGGGQVTVFTISDRSVTASLSGLTITDGNSNQTHLSNGTGVGGGIYNRGTLSVSDCAFSDNAASSGNDASEDGGGIYNEGALTVAASKFSNNSAAGFGGGIDNEGVLTVSNSIFANNTANGSGGGGIYNSGIGQVTVSNTTFSNDSTTNGSGGGIFDDGVLTVSGSTFLNNAASGGTGGGVNAGGSSTLTVNDSTFSNNLANQGGGISTGGPQTMINNCTLSNNFAIGVSDAPDSMGGGIFAFSSDPATVSLNGDIVSGNVDSATGSRPDDIAGLVALSSSDNLIGIGGSGGLFDGVNGNQVGVSIANVGLGTLGNYGGPTETFALSPGSFAIGKGVTETTATTDQRGLARPVNEPSDVGAYEFTFIQPASIAPFSNPSQTATVGSAFAPLEAIVTDNLGNPVSGTSVQFSVVAGSSGATGLLFSDANGGFFTDNIIVTTNSNGIAIASPTAGHTAGTFTVTASAGSLINTFSTTFSLTNTPGAPATISAVGGAAQNTPNGSAFGTSLQAKVVDAYGNPLANVPVTFAAPSTGPTGTFHALTTVPTNALGIATAPAFTANHVIGSFAITATGSGIVTPATFTLTNTAIPAAIQTVTGSGQSASVTSAFRTPLEVRVTNAAGTPVVGITVNFELPGSAANGTFAGSAAVVTNASGLATAPALTANTVAGSFIVSAWVAGVKTPATFTLTNLPLGPSTVNVIAGSGQAAALGIAFAKTLQAQVVDQYGNPLKGVTVTFRVPASGASGTFAGRTTATAVTGANGIATIAITANHTAGTFQATASVAQVATPATFNLTNSPIRALKIFAGSPQSATTNAAYGFALQVEAVDAAGNPLAGISVTFTAPSSGASGTFATSATVLTNANGIATAPAFTANGVAGSFNVSASLTSAVAGVAPVAFALRNVAPTHGLRRAALPLAHPLVGLGGRPRSTGN